MGIFKENVEFIMVEPKTPGNVGAACRALKTMGFKNLRLVNPCDITHKEARYMAHASEDILEGVKIYDSLDAAIEDVHWVVGTTQRIRGYHFPFYPPEELREKAIPVSWEHRIALVFGRERTGLTNDEIRRCHALTTVPAAVSNPSLNLAQAVMLYAYEMGKDSFDPKTTRYEWRLADHNQIEGVYQHMEKSLRNVNFVPMDNWENFLMRFRRFFGRAHPEVRDVNVMHKIFQSFDQYIDLMRKEKKGEQ